MRFCDVKWPRATWIMLESFSSGRVSLLMKFCLLSSQQLSSQQLARAKWETENLSELWFCFGVKKRNVENSVYMGKYQIFVRVTSFVEFHMEMYGRWKSKFMCLICIPKHKSSRSTKSTYYMECRMVWMF